MRRNHLKHTDYNIVPWKNGLGTTQELASAPMPDPAEGDFLWRISIADMIESADFSRFPGADRVLTVIKGKGVVLKGSARGEPLVCLPYSPVSFSGGEDLHGTLLEGPVKNFNVMVSHDHAHAMVTVIDVKENPSDIEVGGALTFFYVIPETGAVQLTQCSMTLSLLPGESYLVPQNAESSVKVSATNSDNLPKLVQVKVMLKAS